MNMKTIPKSECLALIERLDGKTIDLDFVGNVFRVPVLEDWMNECPDQRLFLEVCNCTVPDGVMLGDVLEKMKTIGKGGIQTYDKANGLMLMIRWSCCGFNKSLQQILEGAEVKDLWECECGELFRLDVPSEGECWKRHRRKMETFITGKEADLFDFLNQIL